MGRAGLFIGFKPSPFYRKKTMQPDHHYASLGFHLTEPQQRTIQEAIGILESRLRSTEVFTSPEEVKRFCRLQLATERDEQFGCLFLDTQHRLLLFERLFHGTVDSASVYPRVVVRRALELNASAAILTHNHPSGDAEPSQADVTLTRKLRDALALVDIRVLDHLIVGTHESTSLAERGLV